MVLSDDSAETDRLMRPMKMMKLMKLMNLQRLAVMGGGGVNTTAAENEPKGETVTLKRNFKEYISKIIG